MRMKTVARGARRHVLVLLAVGTWNACDMPTSTAVPGTTPLVLTPQDVVTYTACGLHTVTDVPGTRSRVNVLPVEVNWKA